MNVSTYKMIEEAGHQFYSYDGKLYQSDIVRSCIRPKAQAVGKSLGKHIREDSAGLKVNPDAYMKFLLKDPNPYMSGQQLQEKLTNHLMINNNAFAYIQRDENGYPTAIYPISAREAVALKDEAGTLFMRFDITNLSKTYTFKYSDIIHLRRDYNSNEFFGESPAAALSQLMEIVSTTDQGIVHAVKNSSVVKWLLKFHQALRPEDLKKQTEEFVKDFLKINTNGGDSVGAAATDAKFDAKQVDPKDYVPNASLVDRTTDRLYSFFNTNKNIVQSSFTEDQWIAYYEAEVEPVIIQLSAEYTRKLFTRRERGFGNEIVFESSNLTFASMQTKLGLVGYVDRGILCPNEVRKILNYAPREGGDDFAMRLDMAKTE